MIVLHAVTTPIRAHDDAEGLCSLTTSAVSVLFAEVEELPADTREAVIDQGRRVARLAERRPVLPMRYGTAVESVRDVEMMVSKRSAEWRRSLDRVEGHCELIVHLVEEGTEDQGTVQPQAESGTDYLRRRAEKLHRDDRRVAELVGLVDQWAAEVRMLPDRRRLAVLVTHEHTSDVEQALTVWAQGREDVEVVVTGPWPPFSFCEEGDQ